MARVISAATKAIFVLFFKLKVLAVFCGSEEYLVLGYLHNSKCFWTRESRQDKFRCPSGQWYFAPTFALEFWDRWKLEKPAAGNAKLLHGRHSGIQALPDWEIYCLERYLVSS
jgi:hypothetical protein